MKKRNIIIAMALAMAMTTVGGATVFAADEKAEGNDYTIAYVPTTMNNPFWTAMMGGIKEEMEAKGMDVDKQLVTVDANSDQATMNNYVNDLIAQQVDAIILAPMDCTAVTEALTACEEAGIPVINVDTAVDATDKVVSIIASDNYKAGVECAEDMMSKLDKGAKIAVMDQPSGTACVQREKGFLDTAGDYFEIVSTTDTEGDTAKTMTAAEDVLTADDDLAGFFCINDMGALGCVQAAQAAGKEDLLIYGVDGNPDFMGYVADGSATASAAQQPSVIGQKALDAAIDTLDGKEVEHDQVVDVVLINKDNIADFDVTDWQ
ncbi:MAG: substrate-binding domain-containing protein [Blautia sp.]|uniref:substrate-binding domain-containing protein n=1 Tax=Blautia sp. TaxID=1955243 RepID=UPI002582DC48|nr:substrate-binding domain-containing protein [Blautia sp.]MCI7289993.1 substrate-binding domain-containing protein [Blautia sp.]